MENVIKKLKFKSVGVVLYAPQVIEAEFVKLGFSVSLKGNEKNQDVLAFVNNKAEFLDFLKNKLINIQYDSVLWIVYPKGTSKIKTDINRDILRITAEEFGLTTVAAIAIDEIWSALRFRPVDKVARK